MELGYGRTDITPELGTPCALGIDNGCVEVFDAPCATCLHLRDGAEGIGLVSVDVIGIYGPETRMLQGLVGETLGISPERVVIHSTHTHQSPGVRECIREVLDEYGVPSFSAEVFARMRDGIVQAARQARETTPVTVSRGAAMVERVASNRRCLDGRGVMGFRASRAAADMRAYPEGDIDPFARVLSFDADDGRQWVLMAYACHPTSTGGDEAHYVTADFPGAAQKVLEAEREGRRTLYATGPCGNINTGKWVGDGNEPADRMRDRDAMGERLADAVTKALDGAEEMTSSGLRFAREAIRLPFKPERWSEEGSRQALEQAEERYRERKAKGETSWGGFGLLTAAHREAIRRQGVDGHLETHVAAVGIGDAALAFVPGESFLEMGREAEWAGEGAFVIPVECVDYSAGYIPTPDCYPRGGYEVGASHWLPEAFGIEAAAIARVTKAVLVDQCSRE